MPGMMPNMMPGQILLAAVLALLVFISAVGVVVAKHQNRKVFIEVQALYEERDRLATEWSKLRLEESTWATHSRVESIAVTDLGMILPDPKEIVVLSK